LLYPLLMFVSETTQYGLPIKKKAHILTLIAISVLCINVSVGIILVPRIGIPGMAWGNAVSGIVSFVLLTVLGQKNFESIANKGRTLAGIGVIIILSFCAYFFK